MVSPAERRKQQPLRAGAEWPTRRLCGGHVRIVTEPGLDLVRNDTRRVWKSCGAFWRDG